MDSSGMVMVAHQSKLRRLLPIVVTLIVSIGFIGWRLADAGWDPVTIANLGTRFSELDPSGTEGYDGQFAYYIAITPKPSQVAPHLDVPAYRYQRILYPMLSRALGLAQPDWIPWTLIGVNLFAHLAATWILTKHLIDLDISPHYALIYGLWVGVVAGLGADLYEPLAYALIIAGWYLHHRRKRVLSYIFFGLALFAKETTILFWMAVLVAEITGEEKRKLGPVLVVSSIYLLWQASLFGFFGRFGLGSGGANATSFEWIPYMGFLRIVGEGLKVFGVLGLVFGPTILLPSLWGLVESGRAILQGDRSLPSWALILNTAAIGFLPYSTFREPLGLIRFATGMVLATIYYGIYTRSRKPLNIGMFWIALLAFLIA